MSIAIYTITNKNNNKQYVGISSNLNVRWNAHLKTDGFCPALHSAIKKHGKDSFIFTHFANAFTWENACFLESHLIKELNTKAPNGYNLTYGGDGTLGFKHTKEECKRRSERCPTRDPKIAKIVADKLRGRKRPNLAGKNNKMYGRTGSNSHVLKHIIVATNIDTKQDTVLIGAKNISEQGFNRAHVYACAKGNRKTHLNHTFKFKESYFEPLC